MIGTLRTIGIDCLVVFGGFALLLTVMRIGRIVIDALPMSRARHAYLARMRPLVGALLIATYALFAIRWVLETSGRSEWLAFLVVIGVSAIASWSMLRNAIEGIYLRVGRTFTIGERVEIAGITGRVHRMGVRALVIETLDGQLAIVPYCIVAGSTIRREPFRRQSAFHVFRIPIPATHSIPELKRAVHEAALLCHWSSTRRMPQVTATDDGHLEITVFPVDANHVTEIERIVRGVVR
jgi:small-conductance mechanosensitive channel